MHAPIPTNGIGVGMFAHTAKPGVMSPFHAGGGGGGAGGAGATAGCTHEPDWVSSSAPAGHYAVHPLPPETWPTGQALLTAGVPIVLTAIGAAIITATKATAVAVRRIG
jgi:hypothetical protein